MSQKLAASPVVWTLARDLQLTPGDDALAAILSHVRKKVRGFLKDIPCATLTDLLALVAAKVDTRFIEVHTDQDVLNVRDRYVAAGEMAFADLEAQLNPEVYAVTFRLQKPTVGARLFVSIIDCRGTKRARAYFSKWHEIAHLITLTSQQRLKFLRSHTAEDAKDPEESVMDVIAGELGFFRELVGAHIRAPLTFEQVTALRSEFCPEASMQASIFGFVKASDRACIYVEAAMALKKREAESLAQEAFDFHAAPAATLRAVHVLPNDAARVTGVLIPRNMRIPSASVIAKVLDEGLVSLEANEDLASWESSNGKRLGARAVRVCARRAGYAVQALITTL